MGAQPASLRAKSRPRITWAIPLLPVGLAVFLLYGLTHYHLQVQGTGVATQGPFQGLVALVYDVLGFVPSFMVCLLVLVWSSIWFFSGNIRRPWGRVARILAFGLSLALVVSLSPESAEATHPGGFIGGFLATRLVSVFGYAASTLLAASVALASVLLATDFFFFRYFDSLSRDVHGVPQRPPKPSMEHGVEAEAVEQLRTLRFPEEEPSAAAASSGPITIEEDPLDFAYQETGTAVLDEPAPELEEAREPEVQEPEAQELEADEPAEEEVEEEAEEEDTEAADEDLGEEVELEYEAESQEEEEEAEEDEEEEYEEEDEDEDEEEDEDEDEEEDVEAEVEEVEIEAEDAGRQGRLFDPEEIDPDLAMAALEVVLEARRASASLLQRRLGVSFGKAVELLDVLREQGMVDGEPGEATGRVLAAATGGEAAAEA